MNSFTEIAKKKEEEQEKFKRKSFKEAKPTNRAIGGASPISNLAINRVDALEEAVFNAPDGEDFNTKITDLESDVTNINNNITSLDLAAYQADFKASQAQESVNILSNVLNNKANKLHDHDGTYLTSSQVTSLVLQLLGQIDVVPPPAEGNPTISPGQYGADFQYTQAWSDDFSDANAETLFNRWHPDLMTEALHQAGNNFEPNWRWSANYSKPQDTSFVRNNALHMRAKVENKVNPYRKAYTFRGETMNPQNHWIYLSFLTTWKRKWDNVSNGFITDPDAPNRTWGPGSVFEFTVDLSEMRTQACRLSFYLLPAYENDSNSYNTDGTRGVENDITEVDFLDGKENYSQSKVISSVAAGNTPVGSINLANILNQIDLTQGEHTFTLLWAKDRFVWYVNGIEIQRDTDPRRIPQVPHYLVISREANSGIKPQRTDGVLDDGESSYSDGSLKMPYDVGIWAVPVYKEIANLHNDTAKVVDFKSFTFVDNSVAGVGIGDDTTGPDPVFTSANPPIVWTPASEFTFTWVANRPVSDFCLQVGKTRGGNELAQVHLEGFVNSYTMRPEQLYSGPVNARLWFRESTNSPWNWRDYGFSEGLQPYRLGTDGKPRVTVPAGEYTPTPPTVGGLGYVGPGYGPDGTFASTIDYSGGVVPSDYSEGFTPPTIGVVGNIPPTYSGTATLTALPSSPGITYSQYPNLTGELLWPAPVNDLDPVEKYELVINGIIVYRGTANSFFVENYVAQNAATATVRVVKDNGDFGPALSLSFAITQI